MLWLGFGDFYAGRLLKENASNSFPGSDGGLSHIRLNMVSKLDLSGLPLAGPILFNPDRFACGMGLVMSRYSSTFYSPPVTSSAHCWESVSRAFSDTCNQAGNQAGYKYNAFNQALVERIKSRLINVGCSFGLKFLSRSREANIALARIWGAADSTIITKTLYFSI
jgi:hypothetical protein